MKTILVIEDTREVRENIAEILQLATYEVMQAANGKEGIALARQTRPDLILCDIMMPNLDGYGVLHILGEDPMLADIPFVFLTAKVKSADFRFGMDLGADDYLTKPLNDRTLLNAVALRLRKSERGHPQPLPAPNSAGLDELIKALLNKSDARHSLRVNYPTTQYKRKHQLFTADSWPTALYFINEGQIKLFQADPAGNEYITTLLGKGDFIGHLALLEETVYTETAEILDNADLCVIPKADFMALIYHHQEVATQFTRLLAGDVVEQHERLLKLAYQSVRKRVAEALLMVERKFYTQPADSDSLTANISLPMTLSRLNWSQLVGASTETIIRTLGDFQDEGLIDLVNSKITILDIERLTRLKH